MIMQKVVYNCTGCLDLLVNRKGRTCIYKVVQLAIQYLHHYLLTVSKCSSETAESHLQLRESTVIGLGGWSTGKGVFTLKPIPPDTWVCAYAPTAPFELRGSHEDDLGDYLLTARWENKLVFVDGRKCSLGLGKLLNDGNSFMIGISLLRIFVKIKCMLILK